MAFFQFPRHKYCILKLKFLSWPNCSFSVIYLIYRPENSGKKPFHPRLSGCPNENELAWYGFAKKDTNPRKPGFEQRHGKEKRVETRRLKGNISMGIDR